MPAAGASDVGARELMLIADQINLLGDIARRSARYCWSAVPGMSAPYDASLRCLAHAVARAEDSAARGLLHRRRRAVVEPGPVRALRMLARRRRHVHRCRKSSSRSTGDEGARHLDHTIVPSRRARSGECGEIIAMAGRADPSSPRFRVSSNCSADHRDGRALSAPGARPSASGGRG